MAMFPGLPDPKRVNRTVFGAWFEEDVYDRFCTAVPRLMRAFRHRIPQAVRNRGVIFAPGTASGLSNSMTLA